MPLDTLYHSTLIKHPLLGIQTYLTLHNRFEAQGAVCLRSIHTLGVLMSSITSFVISSVAVAKVGAFDSRKSTENI